MIYLNKQELQKRYNGHGGKDNRNARHLRTETIDFVAD